MEKLNGLFMRCAPEADKRELPRGDIAISHYLVKNKETRRLMHGRLYKIETEHGSLYRAIRFDPKLKAGKGEGHAQILLDYQGWLKLIGYDPDRQFTPIDITMRPVKWYEYPNIGLSHPDPLTRQSYGLGLLAFWLGAIGLGLGILGAMPLFLGD